MAISRLDPNYKQLRLKKQEKNNQLIILKHKKNNLKIKKEKRFKHLSLLFLSIVFFTIIYFILNYIHPYTIANIGLNNSYIILLLPFLLANYFLFSFIFLNSSIGSFTSIILTALLFLKLQHFIITTWFIAIMIVIIIIFNLLLKKTNHS